MRNLVDFKAYCDVNKDNIIEVSNGLGQTKIVGESGRRSDQSQHQECWHSLCCLAQEYDEEVPPERFHGKEHGKESTVSFA